jgi:Flp pilus assembly protein TadD
VNFDLGRIDTAERYLKSYLELTRQNAEAFCYLSSIAILRARYAEAEQYAREAVSLRPNYALAYNNLAIACLNQGKNALARFAMEKAIAFDPENTEFQKNAAQLERVLGE